MPKENAMRSIVVVLLMSFALASFVAVAGQAQSTEPVVTPGGAAQTAGPVAVPPPSAKALRYYRSGNALWVVGLAWGAAVPCMILFTGFSARMRAWARRVARGRWFLALALYFVLFSLLSFVLDLPLAYYSEFVRQHAYGLSNQTLGKWVGDSLKGLGVGILLGALTIWAPYLLLRRSPRRWWLYTALLSVPFLVFLLVIGPLWIDPLFNHFGPMKDKRLEASILALAQRAGIAGGRIFEVDKSVDTETVNAYVAGVFGAKRIVLWDTTLKKLAPREILFVMGHEMGHYVLGHVPQLIAMVCILILIGLFVVHRAAGGLIARYRERFGFSELADVASVPLVLLLFSLVGLVLTPAVNAFGRHTEHEADRFGIEITRDNHACATAFVKLQKENLSNPRPGLLYKLWRSTHPPLGERIDFCNEYKPWTEGKALRYGDRMKSGT